MYVGLGANLTDLTNKPLLGLLIRSVLIDKFVDKFVILYLLQDDKCSMF